MAAGVGACEKPAGVAAKSRPELVLDEQADGRTVTVEVGRRITIRLAGNATTGYLWQIGELTPGRPIQSLGDPQYVPDPKAGNRVGVGGVSTFDFVGTEPGKARLRLEYRRPWEKEQPPARTFTVNFEVVPDPASER